MFKSLSDQFWTPKIWLPTNYSWEDFTPTEEMRYPVWNDVWTYPFIMAVGAIVLRFLILNPFVFGPIASYCGLKRNKFAPIPSIPILEKIFDNHKMHPPSQILSQCAKEIGWPVRKVERWLRAKAIMSKETKCKKFMDCCWQLVYYGFIFTYGLWVMWDKDWMWDIDSCWIGYPHHSVSDDLWWYYMISLAFYWAMVFTHFLETKRKDFWQMFIHHLVTIALIMFSWACNFCRIGAVILVTHDCADIPLQFAKIFIYLKKRRLCDICFGLFALMWFLTRDVYYPFMVIRNTLFEATKIIPIFPAYYVFNTLLIALFILHIFWTYFIIKMIISTAVKGEMEDERSSSGESYSDVNEDWDSTSEKDLLNGRINESALDDAETLNQGDMFVRERVPHNTRSLSKNKASDGRTVNSGNGSK